MPHICVLDKSVVATTPGMNVVHKVRLLSMAQLLFCFWWDRHPIFLQFITIAIVKHVLHAA